MVGVKRPREEYKQATVGDQIVVIANAIMGHAGNIVDGVYESARFDEVASKLVSWGGDIVELARLLPAVPFEDAEIDFTGHYGIPDGFDPSQEEDESQDAKELTEDDPEFYEPR
jgi:hypothetical protein